MSSNKYSYEVIDGVQVITAKFWNNCEHQLGQYMEDTDYDFVVEDDCDFYSPPGTGIESGDNGEHNIIFKLRKNVFTEEEQLGAYDGLVGAAQPTQNRGLAAGPKAGKQGKRDWVTDEQMEIMNMFISQTNSLFGDTIEDKLAAIRKKHEGKDSAAGSTRGLCWLRAKVTDSGYTYDNFFPNKLEEWLGMPADQAAKDAEVTLKGFVSDTTYANQVLSGIAGFFDRYPRIPYGRATSYTDHHFEKYTKCYPFMRKLATKFKELLPERYGIQESCANKIDQKFRVAGKDTPFTTITVNKNFRTSAHRDAGDLNEGFSNLTVVAKDKNWEGGYLVLPEFRVAVNIRPGDLLLINNHGGIHGNTELKPPAGMKIEDMERISLVCYFREKMMELGSWDYEKLRRQFVDDRRLNKDHPEWREYWNGVSSNMWSSQEWYDYLTENGEKDMLGEYHPDALKEKATLEDFF
jgi:hypothetical protein